MQSREVGVQSAERVQNNSKLGSCIILISSSTFLMHFTFNCEDTWLCYHHSAHIQLLQVQTMLLTIPWTSKNSAMHALVHIACQDTDPEVVNTKKPHKCKLHHTKDGFWIMIWHAKTKHFDHKTWHADSTHLIADSFAPHAKRTLTQGTKWMEPSIFILQLHTSVSCNRRWSVSFFNILFYTLFFVPKITSFFDQIGWAQVRNK